MAGEFDFGGAYADTERTLLQNNQAPDDLEHIRSISRINNANAGILEDRRAAEGRLADVLRQTQPIDTSQPMSSQLLRLGGQAMQAGDVQTGRQLLVNSTQARAAEAREKYSQSLGIGRQTKRDLDLANYYYQLLGGVKDQQTLDMANREFERVSREPTPQEFQVYDPQRIAMARQGLMTMRDQLRLRHDQIIEGLRRDSLDERTSYHDLVLEQRAAEAEQRAERAKRNRANAGKDVGSPTRDEVAQADAILQREGHAKSMDAQQRKTAAFDLAARARAIRKQENIDSATAYQRAFQEMVAGGDFAVQAATGLQRFLPQGMQTQRSTYGQPRPGNTPQRAIPAPRDPKDRVPNTYYITPQRGVMLWLGDGRWQAPDARLLQQEQQGRPSTPSTVIPVPFEEEDEGLEEEPE
jgi:hypothetical protein